MEELKEAQEERCCKKHKQNTNLFIAFFLGMCAISLIISINSHDIVKINEILDGFAPQCVAWNDVGITIIQDDCKYYYLTHAERNNPKDNINGTCEWAISNTTSEFVKKFYNKDHEKINQTITPCSEYLFAKFVRDENANKTN